MVMASEKTRRVLQDLRRKHNNNVSLYYSRPNDNSVCLCLVLSFVNIGVFRVWGPQSTVGVCVVRYFHLSGVFGATPRARRTHQVIITADRYSCKSLLFQP